jgi:LysM repeat protein
MGLEKLTIKAYEDSAFKKQVGEDFQVYINPEKYTHSYEIKYTQRQAQGSNGPSPDFNKIQKDKVNFELIFDGTGVVPSPVPGGVSTVEKQIETFKNLVFNYHGNVHSPNFVLLSWASLYFKCRLSTLNINYTLFMSDGSPLRARATAAFIGFTDEVQLALEAENTSPDLTHILTVKAGDTLPLMCYDIYGSSIYYWQVASINGLTDFRKLVVGTQLVFPPLGAAVS